jgi:Non-repetitive/WGA-negative nucleoporin C-terminal
MIPKSLSLTQNLVERVSRLQWLIRFINDNAALSRMSEGCRWSLCSDAEKVESAKALWSRVQEDHKGEVPLLRRAIEIYERARPGSLREPKPEGGAVINMEIDNSLQQGPLDTIRTWVKWCAGDCAVLVECIVSAVRDGGARSALTIKGREPKLEVNIDIAADGAAIILVGPIRPGL